MVADASRKRIWRGGSENGGNFNLSFAGCGFLGIYHVGVASCVKQYAPHLIADQVCGASAGALVASAMITDSCLGDATTYTLRIASKARQRALGPLHPSFNIGKHLREGLEKFLPPNAHQIATGRLNISLTRVSDRQNVIVNQFESKEELIQVLICSSFIPFYCGILPPKYRGVRYVDGGLSDNIPILNENTITVSPFAGESDICPQDISANDLHITLVNTSIQCTTSNLYRASYAFFPPHPEILADTCKQGFDDTLKFLQKNTLISTTRLLTMKSVMVTDEKAPTCPVSLSDDESNSEESSSESDDSENEDFDEFGLDEPSSLPPPVIVALETAIASVNKGLLAPMYNSRAFSVVSLMAAPAILPVDVAVVLAQRLYEWVPYMPSDMQWFVYELGTVLREILYFVKHRRHQYSAREKEAYPGPAISIINSQQEDVCEQLWQFFYINYKTNQISGPGYASFSLTHDYPRLVPRENTSYPSSVPRFSCQLAITEMDVAPGSVDVHGTGSPVASPFVQRRTTMTARERTHHHHHHHADVRAVSPPRPHRLANDYNRPVHCAENLRHELLKDRSHSHFKLNLPRIEDPSMLFGGLETEDEEEEEEEGEIEEEVREEEEAAVLEEDVKEDVADVESVTDRASVANSVDSQHLLDDISTDSYGQFEDVLEVADNTDSILAFYYTEENNPGVVQVTEIFPLDNPAIDIPLGKMRSRASSLANINSVVSRPLRGKGDMPSRPDMGRRGRRKSELPNMSESRLDCLSSGNRLWKHGGSRSPRMKTDPSERKLKVAMSESNLFAPSRELRSRKPSPFVLPSRRKSLAK